MAIQVAVVSGSVFVLIAVLLTLCSAINLNQPTSKPKHIKLAPSTASPGDGGASTPKQDDSGVAIYRFINSHTGTTCILMKTDAVVEIKFKLNNLEEQADSFIPERALLESNCQNEDVASLRISWTGYSLVISFAKYPGGEKWYISNVELTVSPDLPQLRGIPVKDKSAIRLYHRTILIPTPVGKAFECDELDVDLEPAPDDKSTPPGVRGSLLLRLIKIHHSCTKRRFFHSGAL
ncbi:unnamed protein product [Acanthoscelides obtectus]|uniref:Uncharacterized protein n=1 Tax=Acanthoscelides obtectus TaxID=200917 RepID=A0A9P0JZT5_ACAOB|nr:unnamed protein product [Acanthoscelides obtectus]CAK1663354.1 hypothetical protein AOBTE_LOCUS23625 [Acanthoscelides obtectus]